MSAITGSLSTTPKRKRKAKQPSAAKSAARVRKPVSEQVSLEIAGLVVVAFSALVFLSLLSFHPEDLAASGKGETKNWIGPVGAT